MTKRKNPYQPITLEQAIETMTKVRDFYRDNPTRWARGFLVAMYDKVDRYCIGKKYKFEGTDDECYCIIGACHAFTPNRPTLPLQDYNDHEEVVEMMYKNPVLDYIIPFFKDLDSISYDIPRDNDGLVYRSYIYDFNDSDGKEYDEFMEKLDEIVDGLNNGRVTKPVSDYAEEVNI